MNIDPGRDRQRPVTNKQHIALDVKATNADSEHLGVLSNPLFESSSGQGQQQEPVRLRAPAPKRLKWRLLWVLAAVLADILITSYTTQLTVDSRAAQTLALGFQVFTLATTFLSFYLLARDTLYVKLMLYDEFVREFRPLFVVAALDWAVFLGQRAYVLLKVIQHSSHLGILSGLGAQILFVVQRLTTLVYYVVLLAACRHALSDRLYSPECLDE